MKVMYQFINVVGNLTNSDLGSVNNTIFISLKIIILLNSLNLLNYQIDFTSAPYLCSCHRCRWTVCPYRWWTWFPSVATPLSDCMHPTLPRYNIINNLKSNYWKLNSLFFYTHYVILAKKLLISAILSLATVYLLMWNDIFFCVVNKS